MKNLIRLLTSAAMIAGAAYLLAGCVASPEDSSAGHDAPDIWQTGSTCIHLYERRESWTPADSGATCPDGSQSVPMGHSRRLVGDNCGESLALVDYRAIWGCLKYPPSADVVQI